MAEASGPIGGPHFGTLPEKYTVQAPGLEGTRTGRGLGLSAGGR